MAAPLAPDPLSVVAAWAKAQPQISNIIGARVSWRLDGTYPAIRLADVGPTESNPGEWSWRVQVECWAETYDVARDLARTVDALVLAGTLRGTWAGVGCSGARTVAGPYAAPDQQTGRPRFLLDIEPWLYTAPLPA